MATGEQAGGGGAAAGPGASKVDPAKARAFIAHLESQQNLPLALIGGVVAAFVGAGLWAGVTVATEYQIGWMAIGIGALVGVSVRTLGKGVTNVFGVTGGALALIGCVLGNILSGCGIVAKKAGIAFTDVLSKVLQNPSVAVDILKAMSSAMDILFYGLAIYAGYKFSFRKVSELEAYNATRTKG